MTRRTKATSTVVPSVLWVAFAPTALIGIKGTTAEPTPVEREDTT